MYEADLAYSLNLKSTVDTHENADCLLKNTFTYFTYLFLYLNTVIVTAETFEP